MALNYGAEKYDARFRKDVLNALMPGDRCFGRLFGAMGVLGVGFGFTFPQMLSTFSPDYTPCPLSAKDMIALSVVGIFSSLCALYCNKRVKKAKKELRQIEAGQLEQQTE